MKCIKHQEMMRALGKAKPRKEAGEACKTGTLFGMTENLQKDLIRVWSKAREHVMGTFDQRHSSEEAAWGRPWIPCGCLGRTDRQMGQFLSSMGAAGCTSRYLFVMLCRQLTLTDMASQDRDTCFLEISGTTRTLWLFNSALRDPTFL